MSDFSSLARISRPGVPAARSWGSGPRARGTSLAIALSLLSLVVAACGAGAPTGSPAPSPSPSPTVAATAFTTPSFSSSPSFVPSAPPIPSASLVPSSSPSPSSTPPAASIDTPEAAIAAVGQFDSRFLGYHQEEPGMIGDGPHVVVMRAGEDWELTFVSGSGDCPSGCIDHAYAKFSVTNTGFVTLLCTWTTESGVGVTSGKEC